MIERFCRFRKLNCGSVHQFGSSFILLTCLLIAFQELLTECICFLAGKKLLLFNNTRGILTLNQLSVEYERMVGEFCLRLLHLDFSNTKRLDRIRTARTTIVGTFE